MSIKKGDFVEIEYTGKLKESQEIFDTTDEVIAKANNLFSERMKYGPCIICLGEKNIIRGLDSHLEGKEIGKTYTFDLQPEEAFGKKDAKKIQLIQTSKFKQQKITPFPGLQVNIDGSLGTIKTVTGGRTLVDFNHPLSGREVVYDVKVNRIITDKIKQIQSIFYITLNMQDVKVTINEKKAEIKLKQELPAPIQDKFKQEIQRLVKIEEVEFLKVKPTTPNPKPQTLNP